MKYYKKEDVISFLNTHCPKDMWEYQIADLPTIEISEDCISREKAIEILCRSRCGERARGCPVHSCPIIEKYDNLPSVAPSVVPIAEQYSTDGEIDLGDCNICRFAGCSECDDCINGSQWVRMTKEDEVEE